MHGRGRPRSCVCGLAGWEGPGVEGLPWFSAIGGSAGPVWQCARHAHPRSIWPRRRRQRPASSMQQQLHVLVGAQRCNDVFLTSGNDRFEQRRHQVALAWAMELAAVLPPAARTAGGGGGGRVAGAGAAAGWATGLPAGVHRQPPAPRVLSSLMHTKGTDRVASNERTLRTSVPIIMRRHAAAGNMLAGRVE